MGQYALKRILLIIPTLLIVTVIVFSILRLQPADVVEELINQGRAQPEQAAEMRRYLGLDKPIHIQFFRWVGQITQGDFGTSIARTGESTPVVSLIKRVMPVTFQLGVMALTIALLIGLPVGMLCAVRQDKWIDYVGRVVSIGMLAIPSFWIATMIIIYPALWWGYTPPFIYTPLTKDAWSNIRQFLVPATLMGLALSASTLRMTRNMMLEVLRQDYIRTAWSKGLNERTVVLRHALKNAMIPVVTIIGAQLGVIIGGSAIIETIFNLPGMGQLFITSANLKDYPVVQAIVLMTSTFVVAMNLLVDLSYGWLNPMIRFR